MKGLLWIFKYDILGYTLFWITVVIDDWEQLSTIAIRVVSHRLHCTVQYLKYWWIVEVQPKPQNHGFLVKNKL